MVSFISGDCVGFLDPHEEHFFDEDKRRIFSYTWDIDEYHELAAEYGSQWEPFMQAIFRLDKSVFYEGKGYVSSDKVFLFLDLWFYKSAEVKK